MVKNGIILLWKVFSAFLRGISSNHVGDFYCLSCFHSYRTEKRNSNMQWSWLLLCRNAKWRQQNIKIQLCRKVIKSSSYCFCWFRVFAWKMYSCQNNPEKSYTEKKTKHTPSGYSLFTDFSFDTTKNKPDCYRGKYCM